MCAYRATRISTLGVPHCLPGTWPVPAAACSKYLAQRRPYMWQYPMANDRMMASLGEWTCRRLSGRVAAALKAKASELFSKLPSIEKIDVLAAKLPK
jgi:hypothetical protein